MTVPLAGPVKTGLARVNGLAAVLCLDFTLASSDEPQTKLAQHAPFLPFKLIIRRMPRPWIRLVRANKLPTDVSHVERLLEKTVIEGQGVRVVGILSHFNLLY